MITNSDETQPYQGEIWLINFDPKHGSEIGKERPAVVVNTDHTSDSSPASATICHLWLYSSDDTFEPGNR